MVLLLGSSLRPLSLDASGPKGGKNHSVRRGDIGSIVGTVPPLHTPDSSDPHAWSQPPCVPPPDEQSPAFARLRFREPNGPRGLLRSGPTDRAIAAHSDQT